MLPCTRSVCHGSAATLWIAKFEAQMQVSNKVLPQLSKAAIFQIVVLLKIAAKPLKYSSL